MRRPLAAAALLLAAGTACAQLLESVVMPGKVIEGHARYEGDCGKCHVRFDKGAQGRLCLDCHKPVSADLRERRGYHGRSPEAAGKECRACHTEHRGREARIVVFDPKRFEHEVTGFPLRDAHGGAGVECGSCHRAGRKYREASPECRSCHARDDKHKGALGPACGDCHTERDWKHARFDHAKTRFPLEGRHAAARCEACHRGADYKSAPGECNGCHRKDDAHKGRYGPKCESCHDAHGWGSRFRHDTQTRFALVGAHATLKCAACHKGDLHRDKAPTTCVGCHRHDDIHEGAQGEQCARCHDERRWKPARFDHDGSRFPLRERHAAVRCEACHLPGRDLRIGVGCASCHRKDDVHRGQEGESCGGCHGQAHWRVERYDHSRGGFALTGAHFRVECRSCHASLRFREAPRACAGCHARDDKHRLALGPRCEDCHGTRTWASWDFDHDRRTSYPLEGRHRAARCASCHSKAAPDGKVVAPRDCISCHAADDAHAGSFGARCERCHTLESWRDIRAGIGNLPRR